MTIIEAPQAPEEEYLCNNPPCAWCFCQDNNDE
jgi:hypothetical protein